MERKKGRKQRKKRPTAELYELCISAGSFKRNLMLVYGITKETLPMCMYKLIKMERRGMSNQLPNILITNIL